MKKIIIKNLVIFTGFFILILLLNLISQISKIKLEEVYFLTIIYQNCVQRWEK